ncbi:hypothetical protein BXZ70DRAFT_453960 [Cristinia sonorae]|uniref:Zn(2)-C6 fungal-type domain-containing protein n=1 Tax=Cristinia sonorae TaxID=1940300 RepID=A0A8K0UIZ3_9AGAR|nr:hypothetical protein BXZ70DRAFT_453960 [Cristinia sonorae]
MTSQAYPSSPPTHSANSPAPGEPQLSSPSSINSSINSNSDKSSLMTVRRTRSSRACDQCRRNKNKCEPATGAIAACRSCLSMGIACTFTNPSRKRGPPKGYILALERRLQQVEALLGTIIGSQDTRARSLVEDLSQDALAYHIMRRVERGPFSPTHQPLGTTKQDFLESMIMSDQDPYDGPADDTFAVPDFDWHQRIQDILDASQNSRLRRQSLQSATSSSSSHHPTAATTTRSISSPTSHSNHNASFSGGPMTPVDALSPLTPASLTMGPSSTSSPIHTPGNSPYPTYPYMNLPSTQSQPSSASQYAQYATSHSGSHSNGRNTYASSNGSQSHGHSQNQQPHHSASWFHDFNGGVRLSQFGDTSDLHDIKPSLGLGSGGTGSQNGGGVPMVRVYDSSGYDVSSARMQGNGRYPCPA